jgi:hypothetical protein
LVFEKNAKFFAKNWQKSQKIVITTSTPGQVAVQHNDFQHKFRDHVNLPLWIEKIPANEATITAKNFIGISAVIPVKILHRRIDP